MVSASANFILHFLREQYRTDYVLPLCMFCIVFHVVQMLTCVRFEVQKALRWPCAVDETNKLSIVIIILCHQLCHSILLIWPSSIILLIQIPLLVWRQPHTDFSRIQLQNKKQPLILLLCCKIVQLAPFRHRTRRHPGPNQTKTKPTFSPSISLIIY